jgi:hypothetical protein
MNTKSARSIYRKFNISRIPEYRKWIIATGIKAVLIDKEPPVYVAFWGMLFGVRPHYDLDRALFNEEIEG